LFDPKTAGHLFLRIFTFNTIAQLLMVSWQYPVSAFSRLQAEPDGSIARSSELVHAGFQCGAAFVFFRPRWPVRSFVLFGPIGSMPFPFSR